MFEFYGIIFIEVRKMRKKGFSLIELMIVLVIIGILISLIFPAAKKARDGALQRQCANNLNQIGTAFILYAKDNNGLFPNEEAEVKSFAQILVDDGYLPNNDSLFDCPTNPAKGTVAAPDYTYINKAGNPEYPYSIYTSDWRILLHCKNDCHSGGENLLNVSGRVYWERNPGY